MNATEQYNAQMQEFETIIKNSRAKIDAAEKELIVQNTHKEQYQKRMEELEDECMKTFGVPIADLETKVDENLIKIKGFCSAIENLPCDLNAVGNAQIDPIDEMF